MSASALSESSGADADAGAGAGAAAPTNAYDTVPVIIEPEAEERGRLKRRRQSSASPRRASSPSRGHERTSGSRYREHHRKHHRASSPSSSISPPTIAQKKTRRRSDAEPDHTFRGRPRMRSGSRGRTRSPNLEGEDGTEDSLRTFRRRSQPPSRHKIEEEDEGVELRRQRSYHKFDKDDRRDSKGEVVEELSGIASQQGSDKRTEQLV